MEIVQGRDIICRKENKPNSFLLETFTFLYFLEVFDEDSL